MNRELYIYWRVASARKVQATAVMRAWQAALVLQHPGLHARLLSRSDDDASLVTLMETYAAVNGLPAALHRVIVDQGARMAAPWCEGTRHVETFYADNQAGIGLI